METYPYKIPKEWKLTIFLPPAPLEFLIFFHPFGIYQLVTLTPSNNPLPLEF